MPSGPTLGLCVPVYTKIEFLDALLECLSYQIDFIDELVLIDDFNSPEVYEALLRFQSQAPTKITILRNSQPMGISRSTERGIEALSSDFVGFVDSDDLLARNALKRIRSHLLKIGDSPILSTRFAFKYPSGRKINHYREDLVDEFNSPRWQELIVTDNQISHLKVVRKDYLTRLHWAPQADGVQDAILNFALRENESVYLVRKTEYFHRIHPNQHSKSLHSAATRALNIARRAWIKRTHGLSSSVILKNSENPVEALTSNPMFAQLIRSLPKRPVGLYSWHALTDQPPILSELRGSQALDALDENSHVILKVCRQDSSASRVLAKLALKGVASITLLVDFDDSASHHFAKVFSGAFDHIICSSLFDASILKPYIPDEVQVLVLS